MKQSHRRRHIANRFINSKRRRLTGAQRRFNQLVKIFDRAMSAHSLKNVREKQATQPEGDLIETRRAAHPGDERVNALIKHLAKQQSTRRA